MIKSKNYNLELSLEELQALSGLLDIAVKASGLQGAKIALPLFSKIEGLFAPARFVPVKEDTPSKKSEE